MKGVNMWNLDWWKAAGERALRTAAQGALVVIGTGAVGAISDVNWSGVLTGAVMGALSSILTSIAFGMPETDTESEAVDA
jgi:hypothetical protein